MSTVQSTLVVCFAVAALIAGPTVSGAIARALRSDGGVYRRDQIYAKGEVEVETVTAGRHAALLLWGENLKVLYRLFRMGRQAGV